MPSQQERPEAVVNRNSEEGKVPSPLFLTAMRRVAPPQREGRQETQKKVEGTEEPARVIDLDHSYLTARAAPDGHVQVNLTIP